MKSKLYILIVILCYSLANYAQGNILYQQIENARSSDQRFQEIDNVFSVARPDQNSLTNFSNRDDVHFLMYNDQVIQRDSEYISINIPLGNRNNISLDLIQVSNSFYDYRIVTSRGETLGANQDNKHYRGVINGDPDSLVAISFFEGDVSGIISNRTGTYNISKVDGQDLFILFKGKDLTRQNDFECGTEFDDFGGYDEAETSTSGLPTNKCVGLYFETEYDIFQNKGSVANVENYVTALFNQVATIYQNENITTYISEIKVWNTVDPYDGVLLSPSSANYPEDDILYQFQQETNGFNGDLGQLLTMRGIGGGRAAGFNGICNSNSDLSLSVSGNLNSTTVSFPTYSWNVMVITHEFGHLFGSRHTHACVWNGNSTAIDGCSGFTEGGCSTPGNPSDGGTIMSYCHISVGINFNLGFGPQPGNVIRNNVGNGSCLEDCDDCQADLNINENVVSGDTDHQQAELTITANNSVVSGAEAIYHAGEEVLLTPNFDALNGSVFRAYIEGCTDTFEKTAEPVSKDLVTEESKQISKISQSLKIYPNPSSDVFNLSIQGITLENFEVGIYNMTGNLVYSKSYKNENFKSLQIDIKEFPVGIYFVKLQNGAEVYTSKIIKKD